MKISSLLETFTTPSTDPAGNQSQQAPHFGRDPNVLETVTSGSVAPVANATGGMQRRKGKGSMFQGIRTSKKYANSVAVKEGKDICNVCGQTPCNCTHVTESKQGVAEGAYEDGVSDGKRGEPNRRASSIYGPESNEYQRGYNDGLKLGDKEKQERIAQYQATLAPYQNVSTDELEQMLNVLKQRSDERQRIYDKLRGSSHSFDPKKHLPQNHAELSAQNKKDQEAWQAIHQVLGQRKREGLAEKITKDMSAGDVISDFVHSDDPKFKGDNKKQRIKRALGAYYGMHPEKSKRADEAKATEDALFQKLSKELKDLLKKPQDREIANKPKPKDIGKRHEYKNIIASDVSEGKEDEKIAGRYDPQDFDAMVKRVKAKAKAQELKKPVDIDQLAKRLWGDKKK